LLNDLQPNLTRSASNHSIKSQGSSTGSIPAPSTSGVPKTAGLPTKQTGLRVPTPSSATKPSGINYPSRKVTLSNRRKKPICCLLIN
jgi:hypothetical protein